MAFDAALTAHSLAARLADVEATIQRYSSFAFGPGDATPLASSSAGDVAARDLVRRAFAALTDPVNAVLVDRLTTGDATLDELAVIAGLPRVTVWERVNDLVQVGLACHALEGDRAGLTAAGHSLAELVDDLGARVAEQGGAR